MFCCVNIEIVFKALIIYEIKYPILWRLNFIKFKLIILNSNGLVHFKYLNTTRVWWSYWKNVLNQIIMLKK